MTEPERIKTMEEQINLAGLFLGVDLSCSPPEESNKLKRSALDLYRLGHASGFKAGAHHATNAIAVVIEPRRSLGFAGRLRQDWQGFKTSLRSMGLDKPERETIYARVHAHILRKLRGRRSAAGL